MDRLDPPARQEADPIPTRVRRRRCCCCCKGRRADCLFPCEDLLFYFFAAEEADRHCHRRRRRRCRCGGGGSRIPRVAVAVTGRRGAWGAERNPKDGIVVWFCLVFSRRAGRGGTVGSERLSNESDERLGRSEARRRIPRMRLAANSVGQETIN